LKERTTLPTKAEEVPSDHGEDQLALMLMEFTVANLKESCRVLELPVGGLKADLVRRLTSFPGTPTSNQIEEVKKTRLGLLSRGLDYTLAASDLGNRECTRMWLSGAQTELAQRR
jgi:hypothetical protein